MITIFLLPLVMVICGMSYTKRGPKRITRLQGYRSKMSMKNRETWDFAHKNLGDLWFKLGAPLLAVTSVVSLLVFRETTEQITTWCCVIFVIQLVIMVLPVAYTEKALKENFDENGKWRKGAKEKWQEREQKLKKDYQQE
jgi:uncharacterized membrane protein